MIPRSFIYVASPYSDPSEAIRTARFREACRFVRWASDREMVVYSPIVHWHIAGEGLPHAHEFWHRQNTAMLRAACEVVVLKIPGFAISRGVRAELDAAGYLNLPVRHAEPWGADDYLLGEGSV